MEQLSQFTFRLLLIFIPGVIIFFIARKLTAHKDDPPHWAFIEVFLYGILSYAIYALTYYVINLVIYISVAGVDKLKYLSITYNFVNSLVDEKLKVPIDEVVQTSIVAFFLSLIIAYSISKRVFYLLAARLGISEKIGDSWSFAMWKAGWVRIYDSNEDRIYQGWVAIYSDSSEKNELLLTNASIYQKSKAKLLRKTSALFIRRNIEDLVVEFIDWPLELKNKKGGDKNGR